MHQKEFSEFQLHGVYQWVLDKEAFPDLSKVLNEHEEVTMSLRFYPDNTLMFMMSVIPEGATGADRCRECHKLNATVYPYPFGLHELKKKRNTYYFQPAYTLEGDGFRSERVKIDKADQIRFEMSFTDANTLMVTTSGEFDLFNVTKSSFTFVPFRKMNYYIQQ